jgi:hypothetical protein
MLTLPKDIFLFHFYIKNNTSLFPVVAVVQVRQPIPFELSRNPKKHYLEMNWDFFASHDVIYIF